MDSWAILTAEPRRVDLTANAVHVLASAGSALITIDWFDLRAIGFFVAVAGGFCAYAALTAGTVLMVERACQIQHKEVTPGDESQRDEADFAGLTVL